MTIECQQPRSLNIGSAEMQSSATTRNGREAGQFLSTASVVNVQFVLPPLMGLETKHSSCRSDGKR
jgi:hypothetical protein